MDLIEAIKNRRSIRKFKPDPVPREVIERVIKTAIWAPSAMNTQPWCFVVVTGKKRDEVIAILSKSIAGIDAGLKERFNEKMRQFIHAYFRDLGGAPVIIIVLVKKTSGDEEYQQGAIQSTAAAMQNLLLAAYAEGLGTCWMTGPLWVEKELLAYLGMSEYRLLAVTPLGYPDQTPPVPPRKHEEIIWLE